MKKIIIWTLVLTMGLSLCACGAENTSEPAASQTSETAKELTPADQLLADVKGTYDELFTVICDPQYDQIWLDKCDAIVGADMAEMCADMLKTACTGTLYGQDAVNAYTDPESAQFDCYFINGVHQFVFDGRHISGLDENGGEVFSHEYAYVKDFSLGGMMDGYLYETSDENAGEFRYFLMMPDTPESTYTTRYCKS